MNVCFAKVLGKAERENVTDVAVQENMLDSLVKFATELDGLPMNVLIAKEVVTKLLNLKKLIQRRAKMITITTGEITLSPTQINMFMRCQYQWYLRYVEGLKIPPKPDMVVGSSFHKAMERNFQNKMETQEDLPVDEVLDVYSETFEERLEEVEDKPEDKILGELKDSGYKITKEYRENKAPEIQPLEVETYIEAHIGEGVKLHGYADIITTDLKVIDLKTVKRKPQNNQIDYGYQLQLETYAIHNDLKGAEIHYAIQTKNPQILVLSHPLPATNQRIKTIAKQVAEAIRSGNFLPNGLGHSWACNYCGYKEKGLCPYS